MSVFSPGPWFDCNSKCTCGIIHNNADTVTEIIYGNWGDRVPRLRITPEGLAEAYLACYDYGHVPEERARANQRLIRSAPDLLVACQAAQEAIRLFRMFVGPDHIEHAAEVTGHSWFEVSNALYAASNILAETITAADTPTLEPVMDTPNAQAFVDDTPEKKEEENAN